MPQFTKAEMQSRLEAIGPEVESIVKENQILHDCYNELHRRIQELVAEQQAVKDQLKIKEAPLRELRMEQSVLARALGGKTLTNTPA